MAPCLDAPRNGRLKIKGVRGGGTDHSEGRLVLSLELRRYCF
jgi:hypothetical protein